MYNQNYTSSPLSIFALGLYKKLSSVFMKLYSFLTDVEIIGNIVGQNIQAGFVSGIKTFAISMSKFASELISKNFHIN